MPTGAQADSNDYYAGVDLPSSSSDDEGSLSDSPASEAIATAEASQMPRSNRDDRLQPGTEPLSGGDTAAVAGHVQSLSSRESYHAPEDRLSRLALNTDT